MATGRPKVRQGKSTAALAIASVIAVASAPAARAVEAEKEAVRNRAFTVGGRFELGVDPVGVTVLNMMTQHWDFTGHIAYNFNEPWALVLSGGYALGQHTSIAHDVFTEVGQKDPTPPPAGPGALRIAADFHNLWEMGAHAELNLRWSPIYGKLNLAGELPIHFQFYITVGGGVGMFSFASPVFCLQRGQIWDPNDPANNDPFYEDSPQSALGDTIHNTGGKIPGCVEPLVEHDIKPVVNAGAGLRIFVTRNIALNIEFRDYTFPDQFFVGIYRDKVASPPDSSSFPNGSTPSAVAAVCNQTGDCASSASPGFTNLVFFVAGIQWIF